MMMFSHSHQLSEWRIACWRVLFFSDIADFVKWVYTIDLAIGRVFIVHPYGASVTAGGVFGGGVNFYAYTVNDVGECCF